MVVLEFYAKWETTGWRDIDGYRSSHPKAKHSFRLLTKIDPQSHQGIAIYATMGCGIMSCAGFGGVSQSWIVCHELRDFWRLRKKNDEFGS